MMKPKSRKTKNKNPMSKLMGGRGGARPTAKMGASKKPKKSDVAKNNVKKVMRNLPDTLKAKVDKRKATKLKKPKAKKGGMYGGRRTT